MTKWEIPVIAYGLRTDFRTNFFPGSLRLMEVADNIEEVEVQSHAPFIVKLRSFVNGMLNFVPQIYF